MAWTTLALDAVLGFAFGLFGGAFGVGGGIVAIPALTVLFGYDQHLAQGTVMVMAAPTVLASLARYEHASKLDVRMAVTLGAAGTVATFAAAAYATRIDASPLQIGFAAFLALLGMYLVWKVGRSAGAPGGRRASWIWTAPLGLLGGTLSGLFGVGGAAIVPPAMAALYGVEQTAGQGYSLALVAPGTFVGLAIYALARDVAWPVGLALAVGGFFGVAPGVKIAYALPNRALQMVFGIMLVAMAVYLVARSR